MREVHRFIADSVFFSDRYEEMLQRVLSYKLEPTGRKIAIAGAGPAGLTAAFYLAMLGHDVTVYDSKAEAGGMLRFALPEYRLPKAALRREIELIERLGVKFIFNTRVGFDVPLNDLADRFDSVFISIGTWRFRSWQRFHAQAGDHSRRRVAVGPHDSEPDQQSRPDQRDRQRARAAGHRGGAQVRPAARAAPQGRGQETCGSHQVIVAG